MASPEDIERYGASLWRFIGGPVLRASALIAIVIYIYGAPELQSDFSDILPPLSSLTDPDLKEFMDLYGLSAVMPFLAIILFATLVQAVNSLILGLANFLPPQFYTRNDVAAQRLVDDLFMKDLKARVEGVQTLDNLDRLVDERLARQRLERPEDPDIRWIDILRQRESNVNVWLAALRFYGFAALIVSGIAVYGSHDAVPIIGRMLITLLTLAALFVLATWIWVLRHTALVRYRYQSAWRAFQLEEIDLAKRRDIDSFPGYVPTTRWWGESYLHRLELWRRSRTTPPRAVGLAQERAGGRIDGLVLADEHRTHLSVLPLKVVAVAEQLSEASVSSRQRLMFEEWEKTPRFRESLQQWRARLHLRRLKEGLRKWNIPDLLSENSSAAIVLLTSVGFIVGAVSIKSLSSGLGVPITDFRP